MKNPHFYAVIIGSEILNGRREDKHFLFLRDALLSRGYTLFSSTIIKDDPLLIHTTFAMIKNDPQAVMFSFGGIGATPDDLTRQIASDVFSDGVLVAHEQFITHILERFADAAYPHRIQMAELPKKSGLLHNVINNMSGFSLEDRYFFMPGFPEMSHPMVEEVLERFYPIAPTLYRNTLIAKTSENTLINVMKSLDEGIDFSSLPMINGGNPIVEISIASESLAQCNSNFQLFVNVLEEKNIDYEIIKDNKI
jgi:molybdopterin-biosynthesis enzyme MoeA-like protein